jgi:hypothetical protein
LRHFGVEALVFDPGVRCYQIENGSYRILYFDTFEWEWLEPLLKELVKWRKGKKERRKHEVVRKESQERCRDFISTR